MTFVINGRVAERQAAAGAGDHLVEQQHFIRHPVGDAGHFQPCLPERLSIRFVEKRLGRAQVGEAAFAQTHDKKEWHLDAAGQLRRQHPDPTRPARRTGQTGAPRQCDQEAEKPATVARPPAKQAAFERNPSFQLIEQSIQRRLVARPGTGCPEQAEIVRKLPKPANLLGEPGPSRGIVPGAEKPMKESTAAARKLVRPAATRFIGFLVLQTGLGGLGPLVGGTQVSLAPARVPEQTQ